MLGQPEGRGSWRRRRKEAARTIPPREHGGNCDIKNISRGSRIYFPVYVQGRQALDGRLPLLARRRRDHLLRRHRNGRLDRLPCRSDQGRHGQSTGSTNPLFKVSPVEPHYRDFLVFEGIGVDDRRQAASTTTRPSPIGAPASTPSKYLTKFGYSGEQAYVILGWRRSRGGSSGVVDIPNACVSLYIPTAIFEFDIRPNAKGPQKMVKGGDLAHAS